MAEFDESFKKEIHRLEVVVYNNLGMVYRTTLQAPTVEKLKEKKEELIMEHSESAEVIDFSNHSIERIYRVADECLAETKFCVDKITNAYAMPYYEEKMMEISLEAANKIIKK